MTISNLSIIQEAWLAYGALDSNTIRCDFDNWAVSIESPCFEIVHDPNYHVRFYPSGESRSFNTMADALDYICAMARL